MNTRAVRLLFGLVALSAMLFAGFFSIGLLIPIVEVSANVTVNRPVADVFAAFNDPFDRMDWQEGYEGTERVSGAPGVAGSVSTVFMSHDGRQFELREELKAYRENELVEVVLINDMFTQRVSVNFAAVDSVRTEVRMTGVIEGGSWFTRSMMGLARDRVQQQERLNFVRLKQLLEAE